MTDLAEGQFQFSTRSYQKRVSKSSVFKSPQRPSAAAATVPDTSRDTESKMEISMASDVTHQSSSTSPKTRQPTVATTTAADPVLDQFQQMRSLISTFLGACQDLPKTINKLNVYAQKQKSTPSNTYTCPNYTKKIV